MTQSKQATETVKVKRFVCPHCEAANEIAESTDGQASWKKVVWGGVRGLGISLLTIWTPIGGAAVLTIVAAKAVGNCMTGTKITCGQCEKEFVQKTELIEREE